MAARPLLLAAAGVFFYEQLCPQALPVLATIASIAFAAALKVDAAKNDAFARRYLLLSTLLLAGTLAYFKFWNFLLDPVVRAVGPAGITGRSTIWWNILVPAGLSFFVFRAISYVIDVYRGRLPAVRNPLHFSAAMFFFPLLIAGPLGRMPVLLPQLKAKPLWSYRAFGAALRLILLGLFKKLVIGDPAGRYADQIFSQYATASGATLIGGALIYAAQIYADFSGYSDIAIGSAQLLGIRVNPNFNFPYFARSVPDFWGRWHISLSAWLNDYVFTPLALQFRRGGRFGVYAAIVLTFLLSGIWHGAGWPFLMWGLLHALYYLPAVFGKGKVLSLTPAAGIKKKQGPYRAVWQCCTTLLLVAFALIFFRSETLAAAAGYITGIATRLPVRDFSYCNGLAYLVLILLLDAAMLRWPSLLEKPRSAVYWFWYPLAWVVILFLTFKAEQHAFIYFRF